MPIPLILGSSTLSPEFESGIIGMKAGEEKEIEIAFAADYPDKNCGIKKGALQGTPQRG